VQRHIILASDACVQRSIAKKVRNSPPIAKEINLAKVGSLIEAEFLLPDSRVYESGE
jgi:hypothetical protein